MPRPTGTVQPKSIDKDSNESKERTTNKEVIDAMIGKKKAPYKKTIVLDWETKEQIDTAAKEMHTNPSAFIKYCIYKELDSRK